jgi:ParB-like chromosome segregation protein Spo0J
MAAMKYETVKVADLSNDPANARKHGEKNIATIVASLRRFGMQKPIVVDSSGVVRAGNGTLEAARQLGWDTIEIQRTELTSSDAIAYAIADNRTSELAEWDDGILAAQLQGLLTEDEELLDAAGFDEDELAKLLDEGMDDSPPDDFGEVDEDIDTAHECPKCGYKWSGGK